MNWRFWRKPEPEPEKEKGERSATERLMVELENAWDADLDRIVIKRELYEQYRCEVSTLFPTSPYSLPIIVRQDADLLYVGNLGGIPCYVEKEGA